MLNKEEFYACPISHPSEKEIADSVINQANKAHTAMQPRCPHDIMCEISSPFRPRHESEKSSSLIAGGEVPRVGSVAKVTVRRGPISFLHTQSR